MKINEITPKGLMAEKDDALLNMHKHIHGLYSQHFEGNTLETLNGLTREDVINSHALVVQEMERRGMEHDSPIDGLGRKKMARDSAELTVIKAMISVVGAVARGEEETEDLDVLVRAARVTGVRDKVRAARDAIREGRGEDAEEELISLLELLPGFDDFYLIQSENIDIPIRKELDPEKKGYLRWHTLPNPQGPHDVAIEKYDLKLVPVGTQSALSAIDMLLNFLDAHADMV